MSATIQALPGIAFAEEKYLLKIIGDELYNELQDAYDHDELTTDDIALLDKCRAVIVPFAFVEDAAFKQVLLSDNGFVVLENTGSRKPWKWEYNNAIEGMMQRGYSNQEILIRYLKQNTGTFSAWSSSPYNDAQNFFIIRDGGDLQGLVALEQPHRVYMGLRPIFAAIAENYLKPILSEEYYEALNNRIKNETTTQYDDNILPKLRLAAARIAMVMASNEQNVVFSGTSFTIIDTRQHDTINEGKTNANDTQLSRFRNQHKDQADALMDKVKCYMNKMASNAIFSEYYTSDAYTDPNKETKQIDNSNRKGVFALN